jgi:hypothetical protein
MKERGRGEEGEGVPAVWAATVGWRSVVLGWEGRSTIVVGGCLKGVACTRR